MSLGIKPNADGSAEILVNGVTKLKINPDGGVSINNPVLMAITSASQAIPAGATGAKVSYPSVEFDSHSFWSTANSRYLPTVAGYYRVSATVSLGSNTGFAYVSVYKNGAEYKRGTQSANGDLGQTVDAIVFLNGTTDSIEIWAFQAVAGSTNYGTPTILSHLNINLVRAS